jgi:DNA-binding transcriptional MerR regulator
MTDTATHAERIYIREAAEMLNRQMGTLRKWEQLGVLPKHLRPFRGQRGWRYWTPEQIDGIRKWLRETQRMPGKGLPHYNPTEKELDKAIAAMRKPRKKSS